MKLLVCISRTPETTAKISFTADNTAFASDGVQYIMNPYDEWYALVRAIELKEQLGGSVTVINVGLPVNDIIIRKALAIGADEAVRVSTEPADAFVTATQIAAHARSQDYDIIFLGKETIDFNGSEVGGMLAELLEVPFVSYASALETDGTTLQVTRDIEGGVEVVEVSTRCVISAAKGLAEQRIPNMRGIMMAKRKPLTPVDPVDAEPRTTVATFELPPPKSTVKLVDPEDMDELVRLLHEEAKVI
ncbi:MAG: electron transfer flavoprotein subunit beta/FixA family protein [Saprospiraceae bacterium]|nr:electron transfer flavoprotein subunit beta/FixA family protein [Saprospiraceae bacterium]